MMRGDPASPVYRIAFHVVSEPDPRAELAVNDALSDEDVAEITKRLDRLDRASSHGPWTRAVLDVTLSWQFLLGSTVVGIAAWRFARGP